MADELEKFVLQYSVDSKRAESMLNDLQKLIEKTGQSADKSHKHFRDFLSGISPEFGRLNDIVNSSSKGMESFGKIGVGVGLALGGIAAAMTAIGVATKMAISQMNEFNRRGIASGVLGMGQLSQEAFVRNITRASGYGVTATGALSMGQKLADIVNEAAKDPNPISRTNILLQQAGIQPKGPGGEPISGQEALNQLSRQLSTMEPARAAGLVQALGISDNPQMAAQGLAALRGDVAQLDDDLSKNAEAFHNASEGARALQNNINQLDEGLRRLSASVGNKVIPFFTSIINVVTTGIQNLQEQGLGRITKTPGAPFFRTPWNAAATDAMTAATSQKEVDRENRAFLSKQQEAERKQAEKVQKHEDDIAKQQQQQSDDFLLGVNLFASAAGSFSSAVIDQRQAWAAWAGEVGAAAGIQGPKAVGTSGTSTEDLRNQAALSPIIAAAAKKYGVDPSVISGIINVESKGRAGAISPKGAVGLMQVMPSNFASLGITNPTDPTQNIFGGTKLFADYLKRAGGNLNTALMMYHGGLDRSGWGPLTQAYPGKVMAASTMTGLSMRIGANPTDPNAAMRDVNYVPDLAFGPSLNVVGGGQSRTKLRWTALATRIAQSLGGGATAAMVQQGAFTRGDIAFALRSQQTESLRQLMGSELAIKNAPKGMLPTQMRAIEIRAREASSNLADLMEYGSEVMGRAKTGGRELTRDRPVSYAPTVTVTLTGTPGASVGDLAAEIRRQIDSVLKEHQNDIVNGLADNISH